MAREEADIAFWKSIKAGDQVVLSDTQTVKQRMIERQQAAERGENGSAVSLEATYEIKSVLNCKSLNNLAEWRFFQLDEERWLMAKIVDKELSITALRNAPDWEPSTRKELVDRELLFLFNEPENPDNFEYEELTFVDDIFEDNEVNGKAVTTFYMKPQREQHARANWQPTQTGIGEQIATIVEYSAEAEKQYDDPECVILEVGKQNNGLIHLLVGHALTAADINVMQR